MRKASWVAGLLVALVSAGCAMIYDVEGPHSRYYKPSKALGPVIAAPGSEWSYVRRDTGSFGSGVSHVAGKSLPMQNFHGRPHYAYEGPEVVSLLEPTTGRQIATVRDGKPVMSYDPSFGYHWPMWVGETWSTPYRITDHAKNTTREIRAWYHVEALEGVHVPAGTYRAYRIEYASESTVATTWWSPELGLVVKQRTTRTSKHPAGPGTREQDLLRVNVRR